MIALRTAGAPIRVARLALPAVVLVPVAAGVVGTALPAFGWLPAIGGDRLSLDPWRILFDAPGIGTSIRLTLTGGLVATLLSLVFAVSLAAVGHGRSWYRAIERAAIVLLSTPHAATAVAFAWLVAPSGLLVRLVSPELTGWTRPPTALVTVGDPFGLALVAGLVVKETPFLLFAIAAAGAQVDGAGMTAAARTLGARRPIAWLKAVYPRIHGQIRLPIAAVLVYGLSTVEMALILAPATPPPLVVRAVAWATDPDLARLFPAAAAAILLAVLSVATLAAWWMAERAAMILGRRWIEAGGRGDAAVAAILSPIAVAGAGAIVAGLLALGGLAVWSVAGPWRYPDVLPDRIDLAVWRGVADRAAGLVGTTVGIAAAAAVTAAVLVVARLEARDRGGGRRADTSGADALILAPLVIPQITVLFGVQVLLTALGIDGLAATVVWVHLVWVAPYVLLSLRDPWRALDPRNARAAATLGASPWRVLVAVKLPLLARPIAQAAAVGFAVSIGQYLATQFAGGGRIATLTTEAVAIAAAADRRTIGAYAVLQAILPLAAFGLALLAGRRGRG
jgi:putative thiamine transport system permease protein